MGRSTTDTIGILDAVPAILNMDSLLLVASLLAWFPSHAAAMPQAPNCWHRARKTGQFWDGALSSDNVRSEMAFGLANLGRRAQQRRVLAPVFEDNNNFFLSVSPPQCPDSVNTALTEHGAVIFRTGDFWAGGPMSASASSPATAPAPAATVSTHRAMRPNQTSSRTLA